MKQILVIGHGSDITSELIKKIEDSGYAPHLTQYTKLKGIGARDYHKIFSAGGSTHNPNGGREIRDNPDLKEEKDIREECENYGIPMMGLNHGAQIMVHHSGGRFSEAANPRKGIFKDYKIEKDDPLLKGVENLVAMEWHDYNVNEVGGSYDVIMRDSEGNIQIARHKDSPIYMVQSHPECNRPKKGEVETNGADCLAIISDFLLLARNKLRS